MTGLTPGDTKVVSDPRYMLVDNIYKRAESLLICVAPECESKELHSQCEGPSCRVVPKKEVPINPINPCGELAMLALRLG